MTENTNTVKMNAFNEMGDIQSTKGLSKIIKVLTRSDAPTPKLSTIRQIMINDGTFLAPKWFHKQRNQ